VKMTAEHGAEVKDLGKDLQTQLMLAAENGQEEEVEALVGLSADVNFCADQGWTSLHLASKKGHTGVVKVLLRHGACVNTQLQDGVTPLSFAVAFGHTEVVTCLVLNGAGVNAQVGCVGHFQDCNTLHIAIACGRLEVVKELIRLGAKGGVVNREGFTPLELAVAMQGDNEGNDDRDEDVAACYSEMVEILKKLASTQSPMSLKNMCLIFVRKNIDQYDPKHIDLLPESILDHIIRQPASRKSETE